MIHYTILFVRLAALLLLPFTACAEDFDVTVWDDFTIPQPPAPSAGPVSNGGASGGNKHIC
jgi:hypothetical protein